jgi:hypothetical protein
MAKALEAWPRETIEAALGDDCGQALPDSLRLTELHVRLPRYHVAMLEHRCFRRAERRHTTVSDITVTFAGASSTALPATKPRSCRGLSPGTTPQLCVDRPQAKNHAGGRGGE